MRSVNRSQIWKINFGHLFTENKVLLRLLSSSAPQLQKRMLGFKSKEPRRTHWRTGALNHAIPRGSVWHNVETNGPVGVSRNYALPVPPGENKTAFGSERYQAIVRTISNNWGAPVFLKRIKIE